MRRCGSCIAPIPIIRSIVLAKTNLPTLNHIAFEMPEFDSVMRGMGRMKDNGYPIEWGPGRHGPGNNVFAYFCGPDEVPLEYAAEVLQVDDSYQPRPSTYWKFAPGRSDQWGITQPRSARYYRVQRLFGFTADGRPARPEHARKSGAFSEAIMLHQDARRLRSSGEAAQLRPAPERC